MNVKWTHSLKDRGKPILAVNVVMNVTKTPPGPRLNIKDRLSRYGDSHVKDKTAGRTSYL